MWGSKPKKFRRSRAAGPPNDPISVGVREMMRGVTPTKPMEQPMGPKQVQCPHCGNEVSRGFLRSHQKRPGCVAARNTKVMELRGWRRIHDELVVRIAQGAGLPMEQHDTKHGESGTGASKKKSALLTERWTPAWYADIFGGAGSWSLRQCGNESINTDEAVKLYIPLVKEAVQDHAQQEALVAMHSLSGIEGVKSLIFTSHLKATKLRKEAADLRERARKLDEEAETIDPTRVLELVSDAG